MTQVIKLGYISILSWMYNLGLTNPRELLVYAIIYGFSQDGRSRFAGGRRYLAAATLSNSLTTIDSTLDSLVNTYHLIVPVERMENGVKYVDYYADLAAVAPFLCAVPEMVPATEAPASAEPAPVPAKKPVKRFVAPTPEQVTEYARSIDFELDGANFVDYYSARGWMIGKNPMKDWKAAVRTWKSRRASEPAPAYSQPGRPAFQAPAREGLAGHNARVLSEALNLFPNNPENPYYDEQ